MFAELMTEAEDIWIKVQLDENYSAKQARTGNYFVQDGKSENQDPRSVIRGNAQIIVGENW